MSENEIKCKNCDEIRTNIKRKWETQLMFETHDDTIIEWIPYNQFNDVEEIKKSDYDAVYSAIWKDGPLQHDEHYEELRRAPNKEIILRCLYNLQNIINDLLYEAKLYSAERSKDNYLKIYGISQNPDTEDYILVFNDGYCLDCVYLTIWEKGPLKYDEHCGWLKRMPNKKVVLKYFYNLPNIINDFLYEINSYSIETFKHNDILNICGISQNPDTKDYIAVLNDAYCENCSGIYTNIYYKWIPNKKVTLKCLHNMQDLNNELLNEINSYSIEIFKNNDILNMYGISQDPDTKNYILVLNSDYCEKCNEIYTNIYYKWSIWKDGSLQHDKHYGIVKRISNKKVTLRSLYSSQNIAHNFLNEVAKEFLIRKNPFYNNLLGLSQNPDTNACIIVLNNSYCENCNKIYTNINYKWCKPCQINNLKRNFVNWTSGNEKIDEFIQETQLIKTTYNSMIEWIPYNQFIDVKEINKSDSSVIYSAVWKEGPLSPLMYKLYYDCSKWRRNSLNKKVILKYFYSSNKFLNDEPDEWISYNQFSSIKEINKDDFSIVYSAMWMGGPLQYDWSNKELKRKSNKKVTLKYLYDLQDINEFLNEIESYSIEKSENNNILNIYGISQDPITKDYIIVLQDGVVAKYIQSYIINEMQLKISRWDDIMVEWVPYNQFNNVKEIGRGGFSIVYSATWKDGPLQHDECYGKSKRMPNKEVALKCLKNSQNLSNEFLNEIKKYSISNDDKILNLYGISRNPDTKDYIMILKYADSGNINNYSYISINWYWYEKLSVLKYIIEGLEKIHNNNMVHRDFHTGNILLSYDHYNFYTGSGNFIGNVYISDMGLCGEVDNIDKTNLYGDMPYVAPEVLRGDSYTKAADIYSFGMIMYFVATKRQPFADCAHDNILALNICNGIRPKINEKEAPKCYIDLMERCWNSNPNNRPNAIEVYKLIRLFQLEKNEEIKKQFEEAEEYRKANLLSVENNRSINLHPQAYYTSRLLNPFTKDLPKCDYNSRYQLRMKMIMNNQKKNENYLEHYCLTNVT
ncbi:kinase-like domain-containing protein [Rhizophagus clarus]|uniref:Kinase-like domain-containing protein n=1 Tax=Rhizophagus clarus TaxID=94130 RepID=A0A8H3L6W4_9GLOM|nr:kinase-like domain-containing protein [Rhizophagus clarus]